MSVLGKRLSVFKGGLFVVGGGEATIRSIGVQALGPEAIVYGRDGQDIFCAHSLGDRAGLRITRIDNIAWKQSHSLDPPRGEDVVDLTRDTLQRNPMDLNKITHAASMVRTELPCRLLHVCGAVCHQKNRMWSTALRVRAFCCTRSDQVTWATVPERRVTS